jgi:serine/threonine protein kinase
MNSTSTAMIPQTLAQCLSQGRIPVAEALRYSMMLAEALRKIHESGRAHGAVSPATIGLTATGLELLPAPSIDDAVAYKAPEVLDGLPADSRSDVFSFGCVVFEMLSGKRAFEGTDRSAMAPSGSPAVDRLVGSCVVKDPAARIQRVQ